MTLPDFSETPRERAVSDAIAFTLTFSIIMLGVGGLSVTATDRIATFSEAQRIDSAERAMQSFSGTIEQMAIRGDQSRSLSLALKGGNVRYNDSELQVFASGFPLGAGSSRQVDGIEHEFTGPDQDVTYTYSAGAVIREQGDTATMLEQPNFVCRENSHGDKVAVVNVVELTAPPDEEFDRAAGGGRDLRLDEYAVPSDAPVSSSDSELNLEARTTDIDVATSEGSNVQLGISGMTHEDAWNETFRELEEESAWDYQPAAGNFLICQSPDRAVVRVTTIELSIKEL